MNLTPAEFASPEGRILTDGTRDLLTIVYTHGTPEQRARVQPLEHYTFPLNLVAMQAEEPRYEAAITELQELALEVTS